MLMIVRMANAPVASSMMRGFNSPITILKVEILELLADQCI
jgi:hypothetical protein